VRAEHDLRNRKLGALAVLALGAGIAACGARGEQRAETSDASAPGSATQTRADRLAPLARVSELRALREASAIAAPGAIVRVVDPGRIARPHLDVRLPTRARGALRLEAARDFWLEVAPVADADVGAVVDAGALLSADAQTSTDVIHLASARDGAGRFEEIRVLRDARAPKVVEYAVAVGAAVGELRVREGVVEALDRKGRALLRSPAPFAVDTRGVHRAAHVALSSRAHDAGYALTISLDDRGLAYPIVLDPGWLPTGGMAYARHGFVSAKLPDGRVVVAGGSADSNAFVLTTGGAATLSTTEIYDPATSTWTLGTALSVPRQAPGAAGGRQEADRRGRQQFERQHAHDGRRPRLHVGERRRARAVGADDVEGADHPAARLAGARSYTSPSFITPDEPSPPPTRTY
jgi:hypothetical protein